MAEDFPGGGRESQPTVLVSGAARELLKRVPLQLLAERAAPGDGVVVVTTRDDPAFVARRLTSSIEALDAERTALVDCCTKDQEPGTRRDGLRWAVHSPVAFSRTSEAIRDALSVLRDRDVERIHFLFDTLTTQFRLADSDAVLQHAHDMAMTVGHEQGLGVFTAERHAVTDREAERLKHLVDVHVEVRRSNGGTQVRWTGLLGGSKGWTGLADTGIHFDAIGTNFG